MADYPWPEAEHEERTEAICPRCGARLTICAWIKHVGARAYELDVDTEPIWTHALNCTPKP